MHKEKYTPDFVHRFSLARQEDDFFISFDDFLLKLKLCMFQLIFLNNYFKTPHLLLIKIKKQTI